MSTDADPSPFFAVIVMDRLGRAVDRCYGMVIARVKRDRVSNRTAATAIGLSGR